MDTRQPASRKHEQAPQGFTFIELLVVTAILGVVIAVLGACIAAGIRVWDSARNVNATEIEALIGLRMMEKDLMNSFPYAGIGFAGGPHSVSFPRRAVRGDVPKEQVLKVTYSFADNTLIREEESAKIENIISNLEKVELRYYYPPRGTNTAGSWHNAATNFPRAVRIGLEFEQEPFSITNTVVLLIRP